MTYHPGNEKRKTIIILRLISQPNTSPKNFYYLRYPIRQIEATHKNIQKYPDAKKEA
jgi:hypothetical protein